MTVRTIGNQADGLQANTPMTWTTEDCTMTLLDGDIRNAKSVAGRLQSNVRSSSGYFGVRIGSFLAVPPGRTIRFKIDLSVSANDEIENCHVLLREWVQSGNFTYQVQYPVAMNGISKERLMFLTVREPNRVVEPFLIFRQIAEIATLPRETLFTVGQISHDLV